MHASTQRTLLASLAAIVVFSTSLAMAQVTPPSTPPTVPDRPATDQLGTQRLNDAASPAVHRGLDSLLIGMLIEANRGEIRLSQFGQQRAQSQQVKDFADRMIREHTTLVDQLEKLQASARQQTGATTRQTQPSSTAMQRRERTVFRQPTDQGTRDAQRPDAGSQTGRLDPMRSMTDSRLVPILQQFHQNKLALVQKSLGQHQGAKFDSAFMNHEIGAHLAMLAMLETFQNHLSPQAREVIQNGIQHTQQHLAQAQQIEQQVSTAIARQPDRPQEGVTR